MKRQRRVVEEIRAAARRGFRGPNRDGNWFVCCPFCERRAGRVDEEYKLTIRVTGEVKETETRAAIPLSLEQGVWNCYRCSARGFADFRWLEELGADVAAAPVAAESVDLFREDMEEARAHFTPLSEAARSVALRGYVEYVRGRGVWDQAVRAGAGAVYAGRFGGRVLVPAAECPGGRWLGFQARAIRGGDRMKYFGPRRQPRNDLLMGAEHLERGRVVFVVEGPFDFLPLIGGAVAPMGRDIGDPQIRMLVGLRRPLVPCLDGDSWRASRALADTLQLAGADVPGWCHLPPAMDPGKLGARVREYVVAA